LKESSVYF